jgi:hypothetical protein
LITEVVFYYETARGNQKFRDFSFFHANRGEAFKPNKRGDNFFVPSPSANLVGVAKKLQQKFCRHRRDFVCASRSAFSTFK